MRAPAAAFSILLSAAVPSVAQDSRAPGAAKSLCFHAKPRPACSAFLLTNAGAYVVVAGVEDRSASRLRAVADWGFMVNVSPRAAIGASVFASLDEGGFRAGPAARYRRWLSPVASLEFAVGAPLNNPPGHLVGLYPGSIFGLVKWSPARWFAVSARPELVQRRVALGGGAYGEIRSQGRASIGVEAGAVPGLILSAAGAGLYVLYLLAVSGT